MVNEDIGDVPWSNADLRKAYLDFKEIYRERPIRNNVGGMRIPHAFATFFFFSTLKPKTIVESGVWKGQGTWLLEMACPNAELICLDLNFSNLVYKSPSAKYIRQDFSAVDFSGITRKDTICFFDDHQNAYLRLLQLRWK